MPFSMRENVVSIEGHCSIEEAEALHEELRAIEEPVFDLSRSDHLHTSIVQLMMASGGTIRALPADRLLAACFGDSLRS